MRVLVFGGTGVIGSYLTQLLLKKNVETYVTSRKEHPSVGCLHYLLGDGCDSKFLLEVLQQHWDVIVDFMAYSTKAFEGRVHLLLEATDHYIYLSSSKVYADSNNPLQESSPLLIDVSNDMGFLSTDEAPLAKAKQEALLRSSGKKNWTIIRPYITYGETRLQLGAMEKEEWLYRALQGRSALVSIDINKHMTTLTYGLDVARGIESLLSNRLAFTRTFHITNQQSLSWESVLEIYKLAFKSITGRSLKVVLVDMPTYKRIKPSKYQIDYDRMCDRRFDNKNIEMFIETKDFYDTSRGLTKCLRQIVESKSFLGIDWRLEAYKDKFSGERTPLTEIRGFKQKMKYMIYRFTNI